MKCLLIVPNAESALNEEAGRLLLEKYEDYAKHAKLMTSIHAKKATPTPTDATDTNPTATTPATDGNAAPIAVRSTTASAPVAKKATEKKRSLKRL